MTENLTVLQNNRCDLAIAVRRMFDESEVFRSAKSPALWIAPSYRAVAYAKRRLGKFASRFQFLTLLDFADHMIAESEPHSRPASRVQQLLLIEDIVARLRSSDGLQALGTGTETRGFALALRDQIIELQRNDVDLTNMDHDSRADGPTTERFAIIGEYVSHLRNAYLLDPECRIKRARQLIDQGATLPVNSPGGVFFDGWWDYTEIESKLASALSQKVEKSHIAVATFDEKESREFCTHLERKRNAFGRAFTATILSCQKTDNLPSGLSHLRHQLFRSVHAVEQSHCADGVEMLQAPGMVGEARMIARRIRESIDRGVAPSEIIVVFREVEAHADLIHEVFDEYGTPVDIEGVVSLSRNPAVAILLNVNGIIEDGFSFPRTSALLRNNFIQPDWHETRCDPDIASRSETLLRLLGEPRGREAFLSAVRRWDESPPPAPEEEPGEVSRRQIVAALAKRCRAFLERFLNSWQHPPRTAPLHEHIQWLRELAQALGIIAVAARDASHQRAIQRFWSELESWDNRSEALDCDRRINRARFDQILHTIARNCGLARTERNSRKVAVLSAPAVCGMTADVVILAGLGERNFPRIQANENPGNAAEDILHQEQLLFHQVVSVARRQLIMSYPAVDERGQDLLPSSFLSTTVDCFYANAIPIERRELLIDGYLDQQPWSMAEYRVQAACNLNSGIDSPQLPVDLAESLTIIQQTATARFTAKTHNEFDGLLRQESVRHELEARFGAEHVFSPTTLERYIACPFKFFLKNVLRLEPLEEPREDIASTDRGLAFHRALSRLHTGLRDDGVDAASEEVQSRLLHELDVAVKESVTEDNPAAEMLWQLEGERLKERGRRYQEHWQKFLTPWTKEKVRAVPRWFEVGFGLPPIDDNDVVQPLLIEHGDQTVRISGRIDRVDVAELPSGEIGYWIIDYKTGRANYYTSTDLTEFRKIQLSLYALAVEQLLFADRDARPLGLAYWLVTDTGAKSVLPPNRHSTSWLANSEAWQRFRTTLRRWVTELATRIRRGEFSLKPRSEQCTATCDFGRICRISQTRSIVADKKWNLPLPVVEPAKK